MPHIRLIKILAGVLFFIAGIAVMLSLSVVMLWGELESRLNTQQTGDKSLHIQCPLMIAPWESAVIKTVVTNTLVDQDTKPQVIAIFGHGSDARVVASTLELAPLESRALQWEADKADVVFDRLILVNILQHPYSDLPSRQGVCSILVFSIFGLKGLSTVVLLVTISVLASLLGAALLYFLLRPFTEFTKSLVQINGIFLCLVLLGLFSALTRRWGLTLVLDAAALLAITTGSVEILFVRK